MTTTNYDLIVIGGGPVGENVADRAVQGGLSAVIVERELVGGECSYWACMPSKALLRSGVALREAQSVGGAKEAVTGELDVAAVLRRRNSFTSNWSDAGQVEWLANAGIDLVRGRGSISGAREVTVTAPNGHQSVLTANHAVAICTGTAATLPDIPGISGVSPWTSRHVTAAKHIPASVVIIGGGVVATETATAYASLGSKVTLVSRSGLLGHEEPFAGELVAAALIKLGVDVRLKSEPSVMYRDAAGFVQVTLYNGAKITAAEVVVATGREPRTDDLGLESIGLTPGEWLTVDDTMLVQFPGDGSSSSSASASSSSEGADGNANRWLYAVGDVNHRALLTHQGKYQARAAGDVIAARAAGTSVSLEPWSPFVATADHAAVPQVIFTDPEVASVGMTAAAAKSAGRNIRVVDFDLGGVAGASLFADGYTGKARIVVDEDRKVLLGATFVGPGVAELLHSATIAVVGEVPLSRLWHAVPSYPTISEVWLRLLEAYGRPTD